MFDIFKDKKVLVTGHTGFKGSWLIAWLTKIGANVTGVSLADNNNLSLYATTNLSNDINDIRQDIRDAAAIKKIFESEKPDFVFHLAAQALVRKSYIDPISTWETNLLGTVNILDALRQFTHTCTVIMITSDKCYDNVEWVWGYREHDKLGGPDPYSASKGSAELAINSYIKSYFSDSGNIKICSARAGNVIGGGDWSEDRIIPDCVKAWSKSEKVILRNPFSTRPWQHVLEPISGYLKLAEEMYNRDDLHGNAFNFGPNNNEDQSVLSLVEKMSEYWSSVQWEVLSKKEEFYESGLLKLNCDKARSKLKWHAILDFDSTIRLTAEWYKAFYEQQNMETITYNQIQEYINIALINKVEWGNA